MLWTGPTVEVGTGLGVDEFTGAALAAEVGPPEEQAAASTATIKAVSPRSTAR